MINLQLLPKIITILLIVVLVSCGSRKVSVNNTKSAETSVKATKLKDSVSVSATRSDQSQATKTTKESSEVNEDHDFTVSADSATYNPKTGNVSLKGNVKISGKGKTKSNTDKQIDEALKNDLMESYQAAELKDSSVLDSTNKKTDSNVRNSEAKRGFNWWMAVAVVCVAVIAFFAIKTSWPK